MKRSNRGFTIVELVIVIAIIAILASVLIPTFSNIIQKANEAACLQEAKSKFNEFYAIDFSDGKVDGEENGKSLVGDEGKINLNGFENCTFDGSEFVYTGEKYKCKTTITTENNANTWSIDPISQGED